MGKKTLIPEEKWEGLRHAMEEAAGMKKTSRSPGIPPPAEGEKEKGKKKAEKEKKKGKKEKKKGKKEKKEKKRKKGNKKKGKG